ncbi:MAG TPA: homoserine kinase [Polyangiaceae bacterium]|nr:homoserine kinase [Polyangiaceae bacterium]
MGLFTELPLDEAQRLGRAYAVEVTEVTPLGAGSVNSNFRLAAADGRTFFARVYEEQDVDGADGELRLLTELASLGLPVAAPLRRGDGSLVSIHRGKPFSMYPWVTGEILCQKRVTPAHATAIGEALARLHLSTPRVTRLAGGRFRVEDLRGRLDRIEQESPAHRDAALHIRRRLERYTSLRNAEIPEGVIHGDLFRDNALFSGARVVALLDFESASHGAFAFDLMVTVLAWCYGDAFDPVLVHSLLAGYAAHRPLERAEKAALAVEGGLACLRFATTRITDFSMRTPPGETPSRDFRRFLARLEALEQGMLDVHVAAL